MLTDLWVISQLLAQSCALLLLGGAVLQSSVLIRRWAPAACDELQLELERRNYLIGAIAQLVLGFQLLSLLMFVFSVNNHLPGIVRGAMCATGVLASNGFGYPLLAIKLAGPLLYAAFLSMQYLDDSEPAYPLTPLKYGWIYPAFGLLLADYLLLWLFFSGLQADRIATCCSVTFLGNESGAAGLAAPGGWLPLALLCFGGGFLALALMMFFLKKHLLLQTFTALLYMAGSVYALKYFFVKYIYGVLSHFCLFDMFLARYHYVGYVIYAGYYLMIGSLIFRWVYLKSQNRLSTVHEHDELRARRLFWLGLVLSFIIPMAYWLSWDGNL